VVRKVVAVFVLGMGLAGGVAAQHEAALEPANTNIANTASLPAENILLAESAPRRQSLAFGIKFVLAFGAAPIAIRLVAWITERTGGFAWLFLVLSGVAIVTGVVAWMLPAGTRDRR